MDPDFRESAISYRQEGRGDKTPKHLRPGARPMPGPDRPTRPHPASGTADQVTGRRVVDVLATGLLAGTSLFAAAAPTQAATGASVNNGVMRIAADDGGTRRSTSFREPRWSSLSGAGTETRSSTFVGPGRTPSTRRTSQSSSTSGWPTSRPICAPPARNPTNK